MRRGYRQASFALILSALAAAGCRESEPCPEAYFDEEIRIPATDTTMTVNARVSAHTADAQGPIQVSIDDNQGTVAFAGRGPMQAFVYRRVIDVAPGELLFQALGIADGTWYPFWIYCSRDGRLIYFYGESTDSSQVVSTTLSGDCHNADDTFTMPLRVPAHTVRHVAMTCACTATGPTVAQGGTEIASLGILPSQPGWLVQGDNLATLLAFAPADCREGSVAECGSDRRWVEIHSLIWNRTVGTLAFAIWYLFVDGTVAGVNALTGFTLPTADWSNVLVPDAEWTLHR